MEKIDLFSKRLCEVGFFRGFEVFAEINDKHMSVQQKCNTLFKTCNMLFEKKGTLRILQLLLFYGILRGT